MGRLNNAAIKNIFADMSENLTIRAVTAYALGKLTSDDIYPKFLINLVSDDEVEFWLRLEAIWNLWRLDCKEEAISIAKSMVTESSLKPWHITDLFKLIIHSGGGEPYMDTLIEMSENSEIQAGTRIEAAELIGWIGNYPLAFQFIQTFCRASNTDLEEREMCIYALERLSYRDINALDLLISIAEDNNLETEIRVRACRCIVDRINVNN